MVNNVPRPPTPVNEPVLGYLPGSPERAALKKELDRQSSEVIEIPCIINGKEVFTGDVVEQVMPHDHSHVIARVHMATKANVEEAIQATLTADKSTKICSPLFHHQACGIPVKFARLKASFSP